MKRPLSLIAWLLGVTILVLILLSKRRKDEIPEGLNKVFEQSMT